MTRKETNLIKLKPGYWWWNIADLGETPDWQERPIPHVKSDDIFGYKMSELLAKQY